MTKEERFAELSSKVFLSEQEMVEYVELDNYFKENSD